MASEEKLEACPFCESKNISLVRGGEVRWHKCNSCDATGPLMTKRDPEDAPEWNTSPSPSVGVGELREGERTPASFVEEVWKSTRPAFRVALPEPVRRGLPKGVWRGKEFVQSSTLSLVAVEWDDHWGSVSLLACCGIHEDPADIEFADLSPAEAKAIARALNRAAKLAETPTSEPKTPSTSPSEAG